MDISVIMCCHNPRPGYLGRVLDSLLNQTLPKDRWEFLLIDNASRVPLASDWDISWHPKARHIVECELGLSFARRCGMREASADLLIFVDDDNVLDSDYLSEALRIKHAWPMLGVWGSGAIVPEFEVQPAAYVKELVPYLALRVVTSARWSNVSPNGDVMPWGAGLCIRTNIAAAYCQACDQSNIQITDRLGNMLLSGGDVEMSLVACSLGLGTGIFPELKLTHLIPKARVSPDYLIRIFEGTCISNLLLAYKWQGSLPKSPFSVRGLLSISKNILLTRGFDRRVGVANLRATITARRIIAASQAPKYAMRGIQPQKSNRNA